MLSGTVSWFICIAVASATATDHTVSDSIAGSDTKVTVYRLRTNHPWEKFRDDEASRVPASFEELVMERDHERESVVPEALYNFETRVGESPYRGVSHKDLCLENNGNCSQKCESVGQERVCSCGVGYSLTSATECAPVSGCNTVLSRTSGEFRAYKSSCQWTIQAPKHHIIEITLRVIKHYASYEDYDSYDDYQMPSAEVFDGNSNAAQIMKHIDQNMEETVLRSSGQYLLIRTNQGWRLDRYTLEVSYVSGSKYLAIVAGQTTGHLEIPVSSLPGDKECLSLIYSTPQDGTLTVTLSNENSQQVLTPEFGYKGPDGKWKRDIFRIPSHEGTDALKLEFHGEATKVYNVGSCLNLDYHAIGGHKYFGTQCLNGGTRSYFMQTCICRRGFTGTYCEKAPCCNGGVWNERTRSCFCLQGFTGTFCQEGCGPNRYGENCSKLCSHLSKACEGMIFCSKDLCSCGPGFKGLNCDSPCEPGYYGASCKQRCGKCKDGGPCDRYTGRCTSGCPAGYYPPFCQQTYKVLPLPPRIIAATYNSLKFQVLFSNAEGEGEPVLYQVQYKEEDEETWSKLSPRVIPHDTEFEIMGLHPGKMYESRIILIDKDGGTYQRDVPKINARTKCNEPHEADYSFAAKAVNESSVLLEWSYEHDKTSLLCEIVNFVLSGRFGDEHFKFPITKTQGSMSLSDLIPDTSYTFLLTGRTVTGGRTPPVEIAVRTLPAAPGRVRNVKAESFVSGRQLNLTWQLPWGSKDESLRYKVTYECMHLLACEDVACNTSSGATEVSTTSAVLDRLQPHALYQIAVTAVSVGGLVSESYVTTAVTAHAAPHVAPSAAGRPVLAVTNTSASLSWLPPEDCSALNGYIYGYTYALVENDTEEILQQGTVPENIRSVNFSSLAPSHCYDAHITVVSSGGASLSNLLVIPFCTSGTAPDRVQSLSVYKRGRRMVGLRWSQPLNTYGDIEFFTISYRAEGSDHSRKLTTEARHCGAWLDLYCYTVSGLSPGRKYRFQVQARNTEVSVDGEPAAVEAVTSEGASSPPVNLSIKNATESSILLEWGMPDNVNGQLRSFIIVVEQIDTQLSSYECCDDIPLQDYRVTSEEPFYQYEVTGLSPASTYSVTVSAKTVTLGEESRITGHTYPPKPTLTQNALTVVKTENGSHDVVTLQMQAADRINGVNRTYILLCLTNSSSIQQQTDDLELRTFLHTRLTENYHLISEFTQEEVENQPVVTVHLKQLGLESTQTELQKYALILIQDYMGYRSMEIFVAE